jgi:hypothetical protein
MSDRLSLAHTIEETAGLERPKAERLASAIFEAIHEGVATKARLTAARSDLTEVRSELKADLGAVRSELSAVRSELKADIARVEARLDLVEHRLMTRLGGLMVVLWAALLAAMHYWPPGHG